MTTGMSKERLLQYLQEVDKSFTLEDIDKFLEFYQRQFPAMQKLSKFPKRWQDCKLFVQTLEKRSYILPGSGVLFLSEGVYLYLYELFQDGYAAASEGEKP